MIFMCKVRVMVIFFVMLRLRQLLFVVFLRKQILVLFFAKGGHVMRHRGLLMNQVKCLLFFLWVFFSINIYGGALEEAKNQLKEAKEKGFLK